MLTGGQVCIAFTGAKCVCQRQSSLLQPSFQSLWTPDGMVLQMTLIYRFLLFFSFACFLCLIKEAKLEIQHVTVLCCSGVRSESALKVGCSFRLTSFGQELQSCSRSFCITRMRCACVLWLHRSLSLPCHLP